MPSQNPPTPKSTTHSQHTWSVGSINGGRCHTYHAICQQAQDSMGQELQGQQGQRAADAASSCRLVPKSSSPRTAPTPRQARQPPPVDRAVIRRGRDSSGALALTFASSSPEPWHLRLPGCLCCTVGPSYISLAPSRHPSVCPSLPLVTMH